MRNCCVFVTVFWCSVLLAKCIAVDLDPGNWDSCKPGGVAPPTRVATTEQVANIRSYFDDEGIDAYYMPNEDAYQSEYISEYDKRRSYVSGLKSSAGYLVITRDKQALWTDGRYFLAAENSLDCNWILMRRSEAGVPSMLTWLKEVLPENSILGASAFLVRSSTWDYYKTGLESSGVAMKGVQPELVDRFWNASNSRPAQPNSKINALSDKFAGRSWQDKVGDMRTAMAAKDVDMMMVTSLDDTAWLFNLRASDISYNPFFISYAILTNSSISLYLIDHINKLTAAPTDNETAVTLAEHLNTNPNDVSCSGTSGLCVNVKLYSEASVLADVTVAATGATKVWVSYSCSQAIYSAINESKIYQANTPIATTKTKKNAVEVQGMKNSHIRDAAAVVAFTAMLEKEVLDGNKWTELSAAKTLQEFRAAQEYNRGESFEAISASGSNGAIIHYAPNELTDKQLTPRDMYLLDSGGQYLDGTTDVTRTYHFGKPTEYQKECYTLVLMGHIDLYEAVFRTGMYGREIDVFARTPLWRAGRVYRHGTGHGIGMYLSVHEGPGYISTSHWSYDRDNILEENQFFSDEPGYYEEGEFGIRLENIVMVKNASTKYSTPGYQFLRFDHVTLVPYEPNLINYDMLSQRQIDYLNDYNKLIREKVGPVLHRQGYTEGYTWMIENTQQYTRGDTGAAVYVLPELKMMSLLTLLTHVLRMTM